MGSLPPLLLMHVPDCGPGGLDNGPHKWVTGTPHVWILGAEKLSLQSFNLKPFMEIALSAATRHVDRASFLKYAWTAQPDMLVNQIQGRRCRNNDFMPGACVQAVSFVDMKLDASQSH